ncbi:hypothetical protein QZH41_014664, partial [Actinostola sp. cb2023]
HHDATRFGDSSGEAQWSIHSNCRTLELLRSLFGQLGVLAFILSIVGVAAYKGVPKCLDDETYTMSCIPSTDPVAVGLSLSFLTFIYFIPALLRIFF